MQNLRNGLLAIAVLATPLANAQDGKEAGQHDGQERMERMHEALGLSPEQKAQMKAIHADHAAKREAIMAIEDPAARKEALTQARQSHREAMNAVLTPEQREKAKAVREERVKKPGKDGAGAQREMDIPAKAKARTERMTRELDLRPEQAEKLHAVLEQHMEKAQKVRGMEDEAARKAAMQEVMQSQRAATMALLDPAQQERLKALTAEQRQGKGQGRGR